MNKLLPAVLFVMVIAGYAHGDALWYALENGSKVELTNGVSVNLTGRIALSGCGDQMVDKKAKKILFPLYAVKIDNLPLELEPHLSDANSIIALFNGTGAVEVPGKPSMIAFLDGKLFSVDWFLQHQLEHDYGNEAGIFNRILTLDNKQESRLSFRDEQQSCPDTITLYLVAKDMRRTFTPRLRTSSEGGQSTETITNSHKTEVIGHVTIVANAIPSSEEKIDDGVGKRMTIVEDVHIHQNRPPDHPLQKSYQMVPLHQPHNKAPSTNRSPPE